MDREEGDDYIGPNDLEHNDRVGVTEDTPIGGDSEDDMDYLRDREVGGGLTLNRFLTEIGIETSSEVSPATVVQKQRGVYT